MNTETFNKIVERRCGLIKKVLTKKAVEYASATDRLHNFNTGARILNTSAASALFGMAAKHLISVMDIVKETEIGKYPSREMLDEKIGDLINYLVLLEAVVLEATHWKIKIKLPTE